MAKRRGTFAFDLSKPLLKGTLLKQGALHKAFKSREFVVYPGFLVYYDNESKWRLDLTKGETLGGRLGAVKLKGSTVSIARDAPRGCKFGLKVYAPDPANKRRNYLMNASSKEERDRWIEAIQKATPTSPHMPRKDVTPKSEEKPKPSESRGSEKKEELPPPPSYTARQDTAVDAALAVASCTDTKEEQQAVDDLIANVNSSLKDTESGFAKRHNTATLAALTLGDMNHVHENGPSSENGHDPETSIDLILGKREVPASSGDDSSGCLSTTPDCLSPALMSPEPLEATEMETKETVKTSENGEGDATVTTSVTVACAGSSQESAGNSPMCERKEKTDMEGEKSIETEGEKKVETVEKEADKEEEKKTEGEERSDSPASDDTRGRSCSSTQILVSDTNQNVTLSVNLNNYDSDNTLSDEESHTDLPTLDSNETSEVEKSPSPFSSPSKSPIITIKEDRTGASSSSSSSSISSNGSAEKLSPPSDKRKISTPFVEKKGYLYKMGGQRKTWKLRYFVVRPGVFNYFKDSSSHKPLGEVKLKNLSIFFPGIGERKQSFQFTVHTESSWNKRADWVFAGQSEREMKEWITAFKLAGQKQSSPLAGDSD